MIRPLIRLMLVLPLAVLTSTPAQARDDGGFGDSFTNKAPSALMQAPDSQIAQSVQSPTAEDMQQIMPAAGEEDVQPEPEAASASPDAGPTDAPSPEGQQ